MEVRGVTGNKTVFKVGDKIGKYTITRAGSRKWYVQCDCGAKDFERAGSTLFQMKYKIDTGQLVDFPGCRECDPKTSPEKELQKKLVEWCIENEQNYPMLGGYYAIQAYTSTPGFRKGMPDIGFFGSNFFVELKVKANVVDKDQIEMHKKMRKLGCHIVVAYTLEDAIAGIKEYFNLEKGA